MNTDERTVTIALPSLVAAYNACPATAARDKAWRWIAKQHGAFIVCRGWLAVESATTEGVWYWADADGCTCEAKRPCWHRTTAALIAAAQRMDEVKAVKRAGWATVVKREMDEVFG